MNYLQSKKFMYNGRKFEDTEFERKKIYPNDAEKKHALEKLIREHINREFHVMLQKDKFDDEDSAKVKNFIKSYIKEQKYFFQEMKDYDEFVNMIINDIFGLGVLESYIKDPEINEIWVLGAKKIYFDRQGRREESPLKFKNDKVIVSMINKILAPINRKADEMTPLVDARLQDGSRVAITMPPISFLNGPEIVIRKFKKDKFILPDYVRVQSISKRGADFLSNSVKWGANILVVGGTSSGKTTLLNALTNEIPRDRGEEHIITIEDSAELIVYSPFLQSWETKNANAENKGAYGAKDLVKHSLRNSPDRIILGEIRDSVAYDVLQAAITGHKGTMSTIHADNAQKACDRFATLAGSAGPIDSLEAKDLFGDAFDIIVVVERLRNPKTGKPCRVITQISHIVGTGEQAASKLKVKPVSDPHHVYLADVFKLNKMTWEFETTGYVPKDLINKAQLERYDYDLSLFDVTKKRVGD